MSHKINPEIVEKIKAEAGRQKHRDLAKAYGISETIVFKIANGEYGKKPEVKAKDGFFEHEK